MVAEDHASSRAASEKLAPFYGNKIGRCAFVNYAGIDDLWWHAILWGRDFAQKTSWRAYQANRWQIIWQKCARISDRWHYEYIYNIRNETPRGPTQFRYRFELIFPIQYAGWRAGDCPARVARWCSAAPDESLRRCGNVPPATFRVDCSAT